MDDFSMSSVDDVTSFSLTRCLNSPTGSTEKRTVAALEEMVHLLATTKEAKHNEKQIQNANVEEWKMASRVLDRFLFVVFSLVTVFFNAILLTQSPFATHIEYCGADGICKEVNEEIGH